MKFSFKPTRGHNHHIVHETKTGLARKSAWTLCGEYFEDGERGQHQPTCPHCSKLDNPLLLPQEVWEFFRTIATLGPWEQARRGDSFQQLLKRDYVDKDLALTRRGQIIAADWKTTVVPMADDRGIIHTREPLRAEPRCNRAMTLANVDQMSLSRYERLRKLEDELVVSCLSCLGK